MYILYNVYNILSTYQLKYISSINGEMISVQITAIRPEIMAYVYIAFIGFDSISDLIVFRKFPSFRSLGVKLTFFREEEKITNNKLRTTSNVYHEQIVINCLKN